MSIFRNICAHDERLYNTKLKGTEINSSDRHQLFSLIKVECYLSHYNQRET